MTEEEIKAMATEWENSGVGQYFDGLRFKWENVPDLRPFCCRCGDPGEIVEVNARWVRNGCPLPADLEEPPGVFYCRDHKKKIRGYSFWLVKPQRRDDTTPTIQDFEFQVHVGQKKWGGPFINWLFGEWDLSPLTR